MKLYLLLFILLIPLVSAQENCLNNSCLVENITSETGSLPDNYNEYEEINCDNFKWVENYIQESLNNKNLSYEDTTIVNLLKQANYGLQDDLNNCSIEIKDLSRELKDQTISKYTAWILFSLCIVLVAWNYFLVRKK